MNSTAFGVVSTKRGYNQVLATIVTLAIIFSSFSVLGSVPASDSLIFVPAEIEMAPPVPISILSPSGGEILKGGDSLDVEWNILDGSQLVPGSFGIYYSIDMASTWTYLGESDVESDTFSWSLPHVDSELCFIKVQAIDTTGNVISVESERAFVIDSTLPNVRVIKPNNKEVWQSGSVQNIDWTATDDRQLKEDSISIQYSINGGLDWTLITANEPNDGSFAWTVPMEDSDTCQVRIETVDVAGNVQHDRNDIYFTIESDVNVINTIPQNIPLNPDSDNDNRPRAAAVDYVVVIPDPISVTVGYNQMFTATAYDENGTVIPGASFFWTTNVGVINFQGNFTARTSPGTGIVSATTEGVTGTANVTVVPDVIKYIFLTPSTVTLQVGSTQDFSAMAYDIYMNPITGIGFDWNTDVGNVETTGFFTAQSTPGAGFVTATNDTITGIATVDVLKGDLDQIIVTPASVTLQVGGSQLFSAEAFDAFGNELFGVGFSWTTDVGSIDVTGSFTAQLFPGTGLVNATNGTVTGSSLVDVTLGPIDHIVVLPDPVSLYVGETRQFTATAYDEYNNVIPSVNFSWSTDVGSADASGFFSAQTIPGTGVVQALNNSITGVADITVLLGPLDHLIVLPNPATVQVGEQELFTATAYDSYNNEITGVAFNWSTDVGTVDSNGLFTAQTIPDTGFVTATYDMFSDSANVSVIGGLVDHIDLVPDILTIKVGETQQFTATAYDAFNNEIPDAMMSWITTAGVVNSTGFFQAQTIPGSGLVNVTSGPVTASANVTVLIGEIFHILISPASAIVVVGTSRSFNATAYDAYFNLITGVGFNWSTDVGTVDPSGWFTAQTTTGVGVVSATNDTVTGDSEVTVIPDVIDHIDIIPDPGMVKAGDDLQFTAVGFDQHLNIIPDVEFDWFTDVGSVDSDGLLTAQTTVTTGFISATNSSVTGNAVVEVIPGDLDHIILDPDILIIQVGGTKQFYATGYDMYDNEIQGLTFTWSTNVGLVGFTGFFFAQFVPGSGVVQAKLGSVSGFANVDVLVGDIDHIEVNPSPTIVTVGNTKQFTATAFDIFNNVVPGATFIWSTGLGIVNSTGYFTAYTTAETGQVNATNGVITGWADVVVVAGALDHIEVTPSPISVEVGTSEPFFAIAYDVYNNWITNESFYWSTNLGVVNYQGIFTAQTSIGVGYVNATSGSVSGSAIVTIIPGPCYRIVVTPNPVTMSSDGEKQFFAAGYDVYFNVLSMTPVWEVDGGGTVDQSGHFIATTSGIWNIFANYSSVSGYAVININHGIPVSIDVTPAISIITTDDTIAYTATAYDAEGNAWDVTDYTTFGVSDPWGTMTGNIYDAGQVGTWTVWGNYGGFVDMATVIVLPGAAAFIVLDSPDTVTAGDVFDVTVTVYDADSNVKTDYTGTIGLSSSDPNPAVLPSDHTYSGADTGTYTFAGLVLYTWPNQTVSATDTVNTSLTDTDIITVLSPFIQAEKVVQPTAEPGDVIIYYIYFNNTGDTVAANVWINDTLPSETNFISATDGGVLVGDTVQWHFTDVLPGIWFVAVTVDLDLGLPNGMLITNWVFCNFTSTIGHQFQETKDNATVRILYLPVINVAKTVELMVNDITVDPDQWGSCSKGFSIPYPVNVTNLQPVADSIDMEYNSLLNWNVRFFQADGTTLLPDSNGNSIPDTGWLAANGGNLSIVVNITVPASAEIDQEDITFVTGTSFLNPNVIDIARLNTTVSGGGPKEVVLVLDTSGSMGPHMPDLKVAAIGLVNLMNDQDRVAIIKFVNGGNIPFLLQDLTLLTPVGRSTTISNINSLNANANTPMWDAIWDGITLVDEAPGVPVVVAISDGEDQASHNNNYHNNDVQEFPDGDPLGRNGLEDFNFRDDYADPFDPSGDGDGGICEAPMHVFTIGLGISGTPEDQMMEVGRTSEGGDYYYAPTSAELQDIFDEIAGEISQIGGNSSYGSKEMISAGDSLLYKIYYNNTGIGEAGDVWVNDSLPDSLIFVDTNASVPWNYVNGQYCWNFQNVPPGNHWFWIEVEINNTVVNNEVITNEVFVEYTDVEGNSMPDSSDDASVTISEPNIELTKIASTPNVEPGEVFNYTIHYNNTGTAMALFLWINDTFDSLLTVLSHSAPVTPTVFGNNYSWKIPGVMPGDYFFNVTVEVQGGIPGGTDIVNQVFADYTNEDNVLHNVPSMSEAVVSVDNTRMEIEKIPNRSFASSLSFIIYIVYFNNSGSDNANFVWINETIPDEVTYITDTSTTSPTSQPYFFTRSVAGKDIRYQFRDVTPGLHTFIIRVRVNTGVPDGTNIVNHISLDCTDSIGAPLPYSSDEALTVCGPMNVTKTSDKTLIPSGTSSIVRLTVRVKNSHSFLPLTYVNVTDTLPPGVSWVGNVDTFNGTWTWDGSQIKWMIDSILPLTNVTLSFDILITPAGPGSYKLNNGANADATMSGSPITATSNEVYVTAVNSPLLDYIMLPTDVISNTVNTHTLNVTNVGPDGIFYNNGSDFIRIFIPEGWGAPSNIVLPPNWNSFWNLGLRALTFYWTDVTDYSWVSGSTLAFTFDIMAPPIQGRFTFPTTGRIHDAGATIWPTSKLLYVDVGVGLVDYIIVTPDPISLTVGDTQTFNAVAYDFYGNIIPDVVFTWSSNIGSVDGNGTFTAGTVATLGVVTAENASISGSAFVTILAGALHHITVTPQLPTHVIVGETLQFTATAYDSYNNVITGVGFDWITNAGSVDPSGLFTARTTVGPGFVRANNGTFSDMSIVLIDPGPKDHILITPDPATVIVGQTQAFVAKAYDEYGNVLSGIDFVWDTNVGSIDALGVLTAQIVNGTGWVNAISDTITGFAFVDVIEGGLYYIDVTPNPVSVRVGQTQEFNAVGYDVYDNVISGLVFIWSTNMGSVDSSGLFTARLTPGNGTVTASYNSVEGDAIVSVIPGIINYIVVDPSPVTVIVGTTQQFTATAFDVYSNPIPGVVFDWNTNVGTVTQTGILTAQTSPNNGMVTATNGIVSSFSTVNIIEGNVDHISISPDPATVRVGETQLFVGTAYDSFNNVVVGISFDWWTDVGTIDTNGELTAQTTPINGLVTATYNTISANASVEVTVGEVDHIIVAPDPISVVVGEFQQFTATAYDVYNNLIPDEVILWTTNVGAVNSIGYFTAQTDPGTGWVHATATSNSVTGSADVEVLAGLMDYVLVTPDLVNITVGGFQQFIATAYDLYDNEIQGVDFTWSTDVGMVDSWGYFTAQTMPGSGIINATIGSFSDTAVINIIVGAVDHIVIVPNTVSVMVGDSKAFTAIALDAFNNVISGVEFDWSTDVGSVDTDGLFTAWTTTATGSVTASNDIFNATATVYVVPGPVDSITISPDPVTVVAGQTQLFIATGYDIYGNVIPGAEFNWTTNVGSVDDIGSFTAQATPGTGMVTAGNGTVSISATVDVIVGTIDHILVTPDPVSVTVGENQSFTAVAYDVMGNVIPGVVFTWSTDVGVVDAEGLFTAQTTPVVGIVTAKNKTVSYSASITVIPGDVDYILVTPDPVNIIVDGTEQFTATAYDIYNNEIPGVDFNWTTNVGSVDALGLFTAQSVPGSGVVSASNGLVSGSASVDVVDVIIDHIEVTPDPVSVIAGGTQLFIARAYDQFNNEIAGVDFTWTTDVGSVDATGLFTAQTFIGTGVVNATSGSISYWAFVDVIPGPVDHILVTPDPVSVTVGTTHGFSAIAYDFYNNEVPGVAFTWGTDVGAVDQTGNFTAQTTPENGFVTADNDTVSGSANVEVIVDSIDYIIITPNIVALAVVTTQLFTATAYDQYDNVIVGAIFTWMTDVGSVNATGFFTAQTMPDAGIVTATNWSVSESATVEVIPGPVDHIVLVPNYVSIIVGESQNFVAIAFDFYNNVVPGVSFMWNTNVGVIDANGFFTAHTTTGTGVVEATSGAVTGTATIDVQPDIIDHITVSPDPSTVVVGESQQFTAVAYDIHNNVVPGVVFAWTTTVGSIDNTGLFTALTLPGLGIVTATNGTVSYNAIINIVVGAVHHITVSPDPWTIFTGGIKLFTASAYDLYNNPLAGVDIFWSTDVGSIDGSGILTAQTTLGSGVVTASNNSVSGSANVTVITIGLDHIHVTPDPATVQVGGNQLFTAECHDIYHNVLTGIVITWWTNVGTIDTSGNFTAQTTPTATFGTVIASNGPVNTWVNTYVIIGPLDHIIVTPDPVILDVGDSQQFTAIAYDFYDNIIPGVEFNWSTNVGFVNATGFFTAQTTPGSGVVKATNDTVSASVSVDVMLGAIDHIIVSPNSVTLIVDTTQQFTAIAYDFYDNVIPGVDFVWTTGVGVVNTTGFFTAQSSPGTGVVTATKDTVSGSASVYVVYAIIGRIEVSPDPASVIVGGTQIFTAIAYDLSNNPIPGVIFTWLTDVGSIDGSGFFTAQTVPATGFVTASNGTDSGSATVDVIPGGLDHIQVVPDRVSVIVGETQSFTAVAYDIYDNVISGVTFNWTTDVGSIDINGLLTAQTMPGVGFVSAANNTVSGSASVTILPGAVDYIIVTPDPVFIIINGTQQFTAEAYDVYNNLIPGVDFNWTTNVGLIDVNGLFTAQSTPGTGVVTATSGLVLGSASVDVVDVPIDRIEVTPDPVSVTVGTTQLFTATAYDQFNNVIMGVGFEWMTNVGLIDATGLLTAQTTPIVGWVMANNNTVLDSATVDVIPGPTDHIVLVPNILIITAGQSHLFIAIAFDVFNNVIGNTEFVWASDVGSIDTSGMFTAQITPALGFVSATNNSVTGFASVWVTPQIFIQKSDINGEPSVTIIDDHGISPSVSQNRVIGMRNAGTAAAADAIPFFVLIFGFLAMMLSLRVRRVKL